MFLELTDCFSYYYPEITLGHYLKVCLMLFGAILFLKTIVFFLPKGNLTDNNLLHQKDNTPVSPFLIHEFNEMTLMFPSRKKHVVLKIAAIIFILLFITTPIVLF